jgi:hypothetical protein
MSGFDAPIGRCEVMRTLVLTDQTEHECKLEHGCPPGRDCPLAGCLAVAPVTISGTAHVLL